MHLGNEMLAGAAIQLHNGDTSVLSPAAHAHLARCPRCAARLEDLRARLATQRLTAAEAADARFTESALDAQRQAILARLAERHVGARVLRFPTPTVHLPRAERPVMRWIAGSLAAGLFVGVVSGQALYTTNALVRRVTPHQQAKLSLRTIAQRAATGERYKVESGPDAQPGDERDERFLGEIESALARGRRNQALRALDDMTPRATGAEPRRHIER
jgi:hypothetical protein